jgi:hypothetical protein
MKVLDIVIENEDKEPSVTYRQNGDGSWNVRIVTSTGGVIVHTRKKRSDLEKIVKERYRK